MSLRYAFPLAASMMMANAVSSAEPVVVVDSANNANTISRYLAQECKSYRTNDVYDCVMAQLESTLGIAQNFETYLNQNKPEHNAAQTLRADCGNNFNAVVQSITPSVINAQPYKILDFAEYGFLASRKCLNTIESVGVQFGIDYMPSSRAILHDRINNAESGTIPFRFQI